MLSYMLMGVYQIGTTLWEVGTIDQDQTYVYLFLSMYVTETGVNAYLMSENIQSHTYCSSLQMEINPKYLS